MVTMAIIRAKPTMISILGHLQETHKRMIKEHLSFYLSLKSVDYTEFDMFRRYGKLLGSKSIL
jgi:hypothetical protein